MAKAKAKARAASKPAAKSAPRKVSAGAKEISRRLAKLTRSKTSASKTAARSARSAANAKQPSTRGSASSARKARSAKPQTVAVSHYNNADFQSGLRSYAQYRDLGVVEATHGMVRAHVLRFTEPCDPKVVSKLHHHATQFQMVYVLKGWVKTELGDKTEILMRQGSSWTQPPKIKHKINDYSDDAELLEIILPADFETVEFDA